MEPLKEEPENEGEYLEMADHLKKLYDEVDLLVLESKINFRKNGITKNINECLWFITSH